LSLSLAKNALIVQTNIITMGQLCAKVQCTLPEIEKLAEEKASRRGEKRIE